MNILMKNSAEYVCKKLMPLVLSGIEHYSKSDNPEDRTFLEMITFRDSKIQNIIEDTLIILSESVLSDNINEVRKIGLDIKKLREEISELQVRWLGLPEKSLNPFVETKKSLDKKIDKIRKKISSYENSIAQVRELAIKNINESCTGISESYIDYLFVAPNGDSLSQILAIRENTKSLMSYIERQIGKPHVDSLQVSHTYAGLFFIGCRTQVAAYEMAMAELNDKYIPRLEKLERAAVKAKNEAVSLLSKSPEGQRKAYQQNIELAENALYVMCKYKEYLFSQKKQMELSIHEAQTNLKLAVNTYRTVDVCSQTIATLRSAMEAFDAVSNFQMPELNMMYSDVYSKEFSKLMLELGQKK